MIRGLYTSGWGMRALNTKMDVITNNMANADTNGFKRDIAVSQSFPDELMKKINYDGVQNAANNSIGHIQSGFDISFISTDLSQGDLKNTGRALDTAIVNGSDDANAFFTISRTLPNGEIEERYTKNGAFFINEDNVLVTSEGHQVMGENGFITLFGESFEILPDGTIYNDEQVIDRLKISEFNGSDNLMKDNTGLYEKDEDAAVLNFTGTIKQGYIERSNANVIREMMDMMSVLRSYEANQKMIHIQDQTLEKAVNEVGSTR